MIKANYTAKGVNMRKLLFPLALLAIFAGCQASKAAGFVTICDRDNPGNCALINSSGQLSISGSFSATVATIVVTTTNKAGTVTSGGTAQNAIASNASRKSWCIQNSGAESEDLYVRLGAAASATVADFDLAPGQGVCSSPSMVDQGAVSVFAATTGHRWFGSEAQ